MTSTIHDHLKYDVTTSDDPALSEAMNPSPAEKNMD